MDEPRPIAHDHLDAVVKLLRRSVRYVWVIAVLGVLGGVAGAALLRFRHPKFSSQAVLYYQEGLQFNLSGESSGGRRIGGLRMPGQTPRAQRGLAVGVGDVAEAG